MAYTFHVGKDRAAAARKAASCALPEKVHEAIFQRVRDDSQGSGETSRELRCPVFNRCRDLYADAQFSGEELPLLLVELDRLKAEFSRSGDVLEFLSCLERVCRDAKNGGQQLFGFAD